MERMSERIFRFAVAGLFALVLCAGACSCGGGTSVHTVAVAGPANPLLQRIVGKLPADTPIRKVTLSTSAPFGFPHAHGTWIAFTSGLTPDEPDSTREDWESWLVEDAYQDEVAGTGLPRLIGAKSDPSELPLGGVKIGPLKRLTPASGPQVQSIEHLVTTHLHALGLRGIKLRTETIEGTAIAVSAVASDPTPFMGVCANQQSRMLVNKMLPLKDRQALAGLYLTIQTTAGTQILSQASSVENGSGDCWSRNAS